MGLSACGHTDSKGDCPDPGQSDGVELQFWLVLHGVEKVAQAQAYQVGLVSGGGGKRGCSQSKKLQRKLQIMTSPKLGPPKNIVFIAFRIAFTLTVKNCMVSWSGGCLC